MKKAYLFSGLGADERVFEYLTLDNQIERNYIKWVLPVHKEGLVNYAKRIIEEQIGYEDDDELILIGVSFGGIVATEVAKRIKVVKLILISSVKSKNELPHIIRLARWFGPPPSIPDFILKKPNPFTYLIFGVGEPAHKKLIDNILLDTDERFFCWAIMEIATWKNEEINGQTLHIHGTNDRIMPIKRVKNFIEVQGGGHSIIVTHSEEVSAIINQYLSNG